MMDTVENPHAGQGMVVLDIGADIGALVVSAPAHMAGVEIEICPAGSRDTAPDEGAGWWQGQWRTHHGDTTGHDAHTHTHTPAWPHVAVVARQLPDGVRYAAVYPGLRDGDYELWTMPAGPTALTATVTGGRVTTTSWPGGGP